MTTVAQIRFIANSNLPQDVANVNTVQDSLGRLREDLKIVDGIKFYNETDEAPEYLVTRMNQLQNWIEFCRK